MATALTVTQVDYANSSGACREFWLKVEGLSALAAAASPTVVNTIENPMYEDLCIIEGELYVKTASGNVITNLDIGLADDEDGTNIGAELADGLVAATLNATGVKELGIVHAIATPPVQPIWKAKGSSADSFLATIQNGNVDASALVANLLVKVIPVKDMA